MKLSDEQKDILKKIIKSIDKNQVQTLGGYAGTGKSTLVKAICQILDHKELRFHCCAYTGKAANVLKKKGLTSSTIHSAIYYAEIREEEVYWSLKDRYEVANSIHGFIVDESSMVSKEIYDDLCSFGLPIIFVGDHGQLEPVNCKFNLMANPMYTLEQVHRNAGEIAHFAEHLRKGKKPENFDGKEKVQVISKSAIEDRHLSQVDQVICGFNKSRVQLNERVRKEKKINYTFVTKGEKVICLRNSRSEALFNGMQGIVTRVRPNDRFDFESGDDCFLKIKYDVDAFGKEKYDFKFGQEANPFDYAYAITAHKSQGDEFGSVIAFEERSDKWDHVRWCYTVASRAKNSLIWAKNFNFTPSYL